VSVIAPASFQFVADLRKGTGVMQFRWLNQSIERAQFSVVRLLILSRHLVPILKTGFLSLAHGHVRQGIAHEPLWRGVESRASFVELPVGLPSFL